MFRYRQSINVAIIFLKSRLQVNSASASFLHINSSMKDKNQQNGLNMQELFHPKVEEHNNRIDIRLPSWSQTLHLSYVWLRDHCQCSICYNKDTFQRMADVQLIPLSIKPMATTVLKDSLQIQWPDSHESKYDYKFLWKNSFEGKQTSFKSHSVSPWVKATFPDLDYITVPFEAFKTSVDAQRKLVGSILKYGIGFVSNVPPTVNDTRSAIEVLCPVKRTFFGEMWSFKADLEHADTAYSNEYLGAHTDTTYLTEACKIQVFHALKASEDGGETLLVDGFSVAKQFKASCPEGYAFLSKTAFPCEYKGDDQHQKCLDFIFKHHPTTGELSQFRYNIYDRAPLSSIPFEKVNIYYDYLQQLSHIIRKEKNEFWFKLQPGQVMFVDNWRVMHGRNKYTGERIMGGCYLDNCDFLSKARILGISEV